MICTFPKKYNYIFIYYKYKLFPLLALWCHFHTLTEVSLFALLTLVFLAFFPSDRPCAQLRCWRVCEEVKLAPPFIFPLLFSDFLQRLISLSLTNYSKNCLHALSFIAFFFLSFGPSWNWYSRVLTYLCVHSFIAELKS